LRLEPDRERYPIDAFIIGIQTLWPDSVEIGGPVMDYDALIIGTGQAGPALARRLVAAGWNVAIIERKLTVQSRL
jgi:phosphoglycerate dehydrogenase-like enzyme